MKDLINTINDNEYFEFLNQIKKDIVNTRKKVILNTNNELILMYYRIVHRLSIHKTFFDYLYLKAFLNNQIYHLLENT